MRTTGARFPSRPARSGLPSLLAVLLGSGGCTLLVGAQLSDKPQEPTGAGGGGGQAGDTAASSSAQVSSGPGVGSSSASVGSSASAVSSTGPGGMMCSTDLADCDGKPMNGCEINIKTDSKNCGACGLVCLKPKSCNESKCQ
jgi:hypothetical protein